MMRRVDGDSVTVTPIMVIVNLETILSWKHDYNLNNLKHFHKQNILSFIPSRNRLMSHCP